MVEIIVYLTKDYKINDSFKISDKLTKEQITKIVNNKYEIWYYYDIM